MSPVDHFWKPLSSHIQWTIAKICENLADLVMFYHRAALTVRYMSFSLALFGFRKLPVFRKAAVECWGG